MPEQRGTFRSVKTAELSPNPWNPNVQSDLIAQKEIESIQKFGFVDPVTVRQVSEKGGKVSLQIIDGEHRWRTAVKLEMVEVPVWDVGEISDEDAKALTDIMNNLRGTHDPFKQAALVSELLAADDSYKDVLPYTSAEFAQFGEMADFSWAGVGDELAQAAGAAEDKTSSGTAQDGEDEAHTERSGRSGVRELATLMTREEYSTVTRAILRVQSEGVKTWGGALARFAQDYLDSQNPAELDEKSDEA